MNRCWIPFEVLVDFCEGRADAANSSRVRAHLANGCVTCQRGTAWFERLVPAVRAKEEFVHVPAASLARVQSLFRERFATPRRSVLFAKFVFDSRTTLTPAMARSVDSATYQLLYCTEDLDIDLWQEKMSEHAWYLIGQVLPKKGGNALIPDTATLTGKDGKALIAIAEVSEFHVVAVPPGVYELQLQMPDQDILVPEIVIGP